ncbi:hypothetical protein U9M48_016102 [Paspalum notatum var. saurae]|uniref:Uncharacterized protein n=1 Tax=Paspalum notatum var. saurae TaxID=547442 RepID=A0AAQ3T6D0_PASNO
MAIVSNITCLLQDYYDMENCRFAKWVDPPNHQHIEEYISYLKDRIHELEGKVKSLEEDEDKKTHLVVNLEMTRCVQIHSASAHTTREVTGPLSHHHLGGMGSTRKEDPHISHPHIMLRH